MEIRRIYWVIAATAAAASTVRATDRFYPDSHAVSPNGRFRIDAKSPDNAGGRMRPFAANFTYTLTEVSTKRVVWERKQPMSRGKGSAYASAKEASPIAVFVNDDGLVAARLAWDSLVILDAADGHKRGEAEVLQAFPPEEQDTFVSMSTAGPHWSQESDWFFLPVAAPKGTGSLYFVVRPYWNRRLIIDVTTTKHVELGAYRAAASAADLANAPDPIRKLLNATIEEESRRAMKVLATAPEMLKEEKDRWGWGYWDVVTALHTVGFLKLVAAEPQLRVIEGLKAGPTNDGYQLRPRLRETIRRLGKTPAPGAGVQLYPCTQTGLSLVPEKDHPYTTSVSLEDRVSNAGKIVAGMSVKEMTDLIGCPDASLFDGDHCYDYDVDAPSSYTLRVFFDRELRSVAKVKQITPFAFLHDSARMRGY